MTTATISPAKQALLQPTIAISFMLAAFLIYLHPYYNIPIVLGGSVLYLIMYQMREYIYRMGLSRFYFFAFLIYSSIFISMMLKLDMTTDKFGMIFENGFSGLWSVLTDIDSNGTRSWFWKNLDGIIHWKLIVFAPFFATVLYVLNVDLARKHIRNADIQHLKIARDVLFRRSEVVEICCFGLFVWACFVYSPLFSLYALILGGIVIFSDLRSYLLLVISLFGLAFVMIAAAINFHYFSFLVFPSIIRDFFIQHGIKNGLIGLCKYASENSFGQSVIFVPFLLGTILMSLSYMFNKKEFATYNELAARDMELENDPNYIAFGRDVNNKEVKLTYAELNMHMFVNGTTGGGKTVAFMNLVDGACRDGLPVVYIDGKGSNDLVDLMRSTANKYGRTFKVFTVKPFGINDVAGYDFLGSGAFTERKNRIMSLFPIATDAGSSYFQDRLNRYVNSIFRLADIHKLNLDLYNFLKLVQNTDEALELANMSKNEGLIEYFKWIKDLTKDNPRDRILDTLDVFINSSYGHLFEIKGRQNVINLKNSINNKEVVLFLFDSSAYPTDTAKIAKMVISDINATFSGFGEQKKVNKTLCIFDEFASYANDALSGTISVHRSNGMHACIGTQSITTVGMVSKDTERVAEELLSCCNTFLVLATTNDKDCKRFAELYGTKKMFEVTTHVDTELQQVTGIHNKQSEDYIVTPQDIKSIPVRRGIGYIYRKAAGKAPVKIQVYNKGV